MDGRVDQAQVVGRGHPGAGVGQGLGQGEALLQVAAGGVGGEPVRCRRPGGARSARPARSHWLSFQSSGWKGGWHYRQLFELTRLDEAIAIYGTEADALVAADGR